MHRRVLEIASRGHQGSKRFLLPVVVTKVAKLFIRRALVSRTSRGGPDVELLRRRTSLSRSDLFPGFREPCTFKWTTFYFRARFIVHIPVIPFDYARPMVC